MSQSPEKETGVGIRNLVDTTSGSLHALENLDADVKDAMLIHTITQRLPKETLALWEQRMETTTELPEFSNLTEFLIQRSRSLEKLQMSNSFNSPVFKKPQACGLLFHIAL